MLNKMIFSLALSAISLTSQAATESMVWGNAPKKMQSVVSSSSLANGQQIRHQQTYRGIPIWGYQLIEHSGKGSEPRWTGTHVENVEQDVKSIAPTLSESQANDIVAKTRTGKTVLETIEKVIFVDNQKKAHLAYHIGSYVRQENGAIQAPNFMIDAHSGDILKQWDDAHHLRVGQGLGGNLFQLPYRLGMFQYGSLNENIPSLGPFEVNVKKNRCSFESKNFRIYDVRDRDPDIFMLPILRPMETILHFKPYAYDCDEKTGYRHNMDDEGPMNYSFSTANDAMYFGEKIIEMYEKYYHHANPVGKDLPIRVYIHVKGLDNAMAVATRRGRGIILAHQQIIIGNGEELISPSMQGVIAHELTHNVTKQNSGLISVDQSGALNESFSDMASIALKDYVRREFPWYWDGKTWTLGETSTLGGFPMRYFDDPSKDNISIGHVKDYEEGMEIHRGSGIFNKAFYLLANSEGWTVSKAFRVMFDANIKYWVPNSQFDSAACGVIQATKDRGWSTLAVVHAFDQVGVHCPLSI